MEPLGDAAPGEDWRRIVERVNRQFPISEGDIAVPVALGLEAGTVVAQAQVPLNRLGGFLRVTGASLVKAGHEDALFWLQSRTSMARAGHEAVHGVVIDVDVVHRDVLAVLTDNGLDLPAFWFRTPRGTKLLYAFARPAPDALAEAFAARVALGIPGADLDAVPLWHGHRLPGARKRGVVGYTIEVDGHVASVAVAPIAIEDWTPTLPARFAGPMRIRARLSPPERAEVEAHLHRRGLTVPDEGASAGPFRNCPENVGHDEPCCYVYRVDGRLSVSCHGGHDGISRQRSWTEDQLLAMARSREAVTATEPDRQSPILALTWAAERILDQRLGDVPGATALHRTVARRLIVTAAAVALAREHVTEGWSLSAALVPAVRLIQARLDGIDLEVGPIRPFFDRRRKALRVLGHDDAPRPLSRGNLSNFKQSMHLWHATTATTLEPGGPRFAEHPFARSRLSIAANGDPRALAALGIPVLNVEPFPVAFATTHFDVDEQLPSLVVGDVVPRLPETDLDVVAFFLDLFRAGRLPLVDEGDVRRFVMLLAAPLVRRLVPGQQGIYLVTGPSGAGKDFLIGLAIDTHTAAVSSGEGAGFEISVENDSERKRTFAAGAGKLYARIKEAGKRGRTNEVDNLLVRLSGSPDVPSRAINSDEVTLPNGFVYVVDALEGVSSRVELARRTVTISASSVGDETALGETSALVIAQATQILAGLRQLIETQDKSFYSQQPATDSRPVLQVALARLLGAELVKVRGADLDDLWRAFAAFVADRAAAEHLHMAKSYEGREKRDGPLPALFATARLARFLEAMAKDASFADALDFPDAQSLAKHIMREARYDPRKKDSFVEARVGAREWVFRLFKDNRNFIFVPREEYDQKLGRVEATGVTAAVVAEGGS